MQQLTTGRWMYRSTVRSWLHAGRQRTAVDACVYPEQPESCSQLPCSRYLPQSCVTFHYKRRWAAGIGPSSCARAAAAAARSAPRRNLKGEGPYSDRTSVFEY